VDQASVGEAQAVVGSAALMASISPLAVDIVIPVYNAEGDLRRCVDSVLEHTGGDHRLLLIDDASPSVGVQAYFAELNRRALPQVQLLANERNLGFTLTANRGMQSARAASDVVLLNSDTIVSRGWLDKLARCAGSDPRIGTVTPFSNNAEICSLPRFCENNPWPPGRDPETTLRALEQAAVPTYPDIPTGVGFCLYIRRALIDAIGGFEPAFGLGYGEENDFCMRAVAAGFRNVLCDDAFVVHTGGSSFGAKRTDLAQRNMRLLLQRHPEYLEIVSGYIAADPLRPLRELALHHYRMLTDRLPGILHIMHDHGGGTEYHVRALIAAASSTFHQYLLIAVGEAWQLEEHAGSEIHSYDFHRRDGEPWPDLLRGLCARFGIELIHLHNISGCREGLLTALGEVDVPYGYTVHDLNFACPTITFLNADQRFCGGVTESQVCGACLYAQPDFASIDIDGWRSRHRVLLDKAAFVIAPSHWAADILRRYFPQRAIDVIPHGNATGMGRADAINAPLTMVDDGRPVVAVLGAIGPDKGARRLERLVEMTRQRNLHLRWVLIGYLDRGREPWQSPDGTFTMHGPYDSRALRALLAEYRVALVAYPSAGPETFSYTLSEAWAAGLPAVVPPIGALADRVASTGGGWVLTDEEWQSEGMMLDRIASLFEPSRKEEFAAVVARTRAVPQATLNTMIDATLAVYRKARNRSDTRIASASIAAARCLTALHYTPWHPPARPAAAVPHVEVVEASPIAAMTRVAQAALRIRHTAAGRLLHRLAPKALLATLKSHLPS
jgi:GT2 family glycosyltransferase/glycosyltransferase involved in cell wall biosynthesis